MVSNSTLIDVVEHFHKIMMPKYKWWRWTVIDRWFEMTNCINLQNWPVDACWTKHPLKIMKYCWLHTDERCHCFNTSFGTQQQMTLRKNGLHASVKFWRQHWLTTYRDELLMADGELTMSNFRGKSKRWCQISTTQKVRFTCRLNYWWTKYQLLSLNRRGWQHV